MNRKGISLRNPWATRKLAKFYTQALAKQPLTPAQFFLLRQVWLEDGLPLRDLGLHAQLDATSATWLVDQLERARLVERRRNDPDRRIVRIWLTASGRALCDTLEPELARWEAALGDALSPSHSREDIAAFRAVLTTLITVLPEGDDLWDEISTSWDRHLDLLRHVTEAGEKKGIQTDNGDKNTQ